MAGPVVDAGAGRGACVGPHVINDRFLLVGDSARSGGLSEVRKAVDTANSDSDR